jgi:hypothetical protein
MVGQQIPLMYLNLALALGQSLALVTLRVHFPTGNFLHLLISITLLLALNVSMLNVTAKEFFFYFK